MAIVDLSLLAAPDVVDELDYETILAERKATLVSLYPEEQQEAVARTLTLESEPMVKLLQENAYREVIWRQRVNESARAVMLAYAAGNDLDNIGANFSVGRLVITPADETTLPPTPAVMESDTDYGICDFASFITAIAMRIAASILIVRMFSAFHFLRIIFCATANVLPVVR